jgi:tetratricopeptide (TPR) repeat protein
MLYLVVQLMGWHGDAADAKRLLPTLTQGDRAERVLELFMENGDIMPPPPGRASEIVYRAAGIASSRGRDAQAETLYELTLDINPDHAMTCNDYGYFLVERHTRLDKAQTLLERAATLEPGNANVLDSLGWLRYKQGKFKDDAAAGGVEGSGALSLLADAARTSRLDGNPEILDHFGDALWREGRKDEAKTNWQQASQIVRSALDAFNAGAARPSAYVEKLYRAISTRAQDKLDNVKAGREPTLAPTFDEEKK